MKARIQKTTPLKAKADVLVLGVFKNEKHNPLFERVDRVLNKALSALQREKSFQARAREVFALSTLGRLPAKHVLLVGLGEKKGANAETLRACSAAALLSASALKAKTIASALHQAMVGKNDVELLRASAEGFLLADYDYHEFRTQELDEFHQVGSVSFLIDKDKPALAQVVREAVAVCQEVRWARDLINKPSNIKTPVYIASAVKKRAKKYRALKVKVYDRRALEKGKFNAILAVNQGSHDEPRLVVLDYNPSRKKGGPELVLVGKGITYDTGGINVKPYRFMKNMRQDMAGAAGVLAGGLAIAKLGIKKHVAVITPLTDNSIGGGAIKPEDIIKGHSGKTIKVGHTDAEGRLVLSDALSLATEMKAGAVVDLATLTGASIYAVGYEFGAVFSNNEKLLRQVKAAGARTHERVWELPLVPEYEDLVKGKYADVVNIARGDSPHASCSTAAAFLKAFVGKTPWCHIDIGASAFLEKENTFHPYNRAGGVGWGVRLFVDLAKNWKKV